MRARTREQSGYRAAIARVSSVLTLSTITMSCAQDRRSSVRAMFGASLNVRIERRDLVQHLAGLTERFVQRFHLRGDAVPRISRRRGAAALAHRVSGAPASFDSPRDRAAKHAPARRRRRGRRRCRGPDRPTPTSGDTITGRPAAIASSTTLPKFSEYDGRTRARAPCEQRRLVGAVQRVPVKITRSRTPLRARDAIRAPAGIPLRRCRRRPGARPARAAAPRSSDRAPSSS